MLQYICDLPFQMGVEADQAICDYAEKELLLPAAERLSWHRSKRLIQNGQNPFENVLEFGK